MKQFLKRIIPPSLWAKVRQAKTNYIVKNYSPREVHHTYGDFPLKVLISDPLAEGWYDHDWAPLPEVAMLSQHRLRSGATVFDLGAHQCVVALMLSQVVGPAGKVIALEASAHNAEAGRKNCALNGAHQVTVLHAAAADTSGTLIFNEDLNGQVEDGLNKAGQTEVRACSVDDLAREYGMPDVLFVDVEGYECRVLEGAKSTLKTGLDCFVEVHLGAGLEHFGGSAQAVAAFFPQDTYDLYINTGDSSFLRVMPPYDLPATRFFLIAICTRNANAV